VTIRHQTSILAGCGQWLRPSAAHQNGLHFLPMQIRNGYRPFLHYTTQLNVY
jgi:hypothetical protein